MYRLTTSCIATALTLVFVTRCESQDAKPGPDYDHVRPMEWMIGDWEGTYTVIPGGMLASAYPPGAKVRSANSYSWMENKNYIALKFHEGIDGKIVHQGFELIGKDPQLKKIVHWIFSIAGGSGVGEWSLDGKTWKLKWSYTSGNGTKYEGVSFLVPVDANTHTWEMKEVKENGKKVADAPLITYRRVSKKPN